MSELINKITKSIVKPNRKSIIFDLENFHDTTFYTDVISVKKALFQILKSMYRHTPAKATISIYSQIDDSDNVIIGIANNIQDELDIQPKRSFTSHGKLRSAISNLNGICEYEICANFQGGFKKINMFNENVETIQNPDKLIGFTHLIKFSCI